MTLKQVFRNFRTKLLRFSRRSGRNEASDFHQDNQVLTKLGQGFEGFRTKRDTPI